MVRITERRTFSAPSEPIPPYSRVESLRVTGSRAETASGTVRTAPIRKKIKAAMRTASSSWVGPVAGWYRKTKAGANQGESAYPHHRPDLLAGARPHGQRLNGRDARRLARRQQGGQQRPQQAHAGTLSRSARVKDTVCASTWKKPRIKDISPRARNIPAPSPAGSQQ